MIINKIEIDFGRLSIQIDNNTDVCVIGITHNNWRKTTTASHAASADQSRIQINTYEFCAGSIGPTFISSCCGVILHHRAGGILQSNPHLIE